MKPLEDVLGKVGDLKRDLSAEIVVQEETSHIEPEKGHNEEIIERNPVIGGERGDSYNFPTGEYEWVVDEPERRVIDSPRITEPDTKKREISRIQLQQIYDSSQWYSARYDAGLGLGVDRDDLERQLGGWIQELAQEVNMLNNAERVNNARVDLRYLYKVSTTKDIRAGVAELLGIRQYKFLSDEILRGTKLSKDELETIYKTRALPQEVRLKAAKELNYSPLKVWRGDHPILAGLTGVRLFVK